MKDSFCVLEKVHAAMLQYGLVRKPENRYQSDVEEKNRTKWVEVHLGIDALNGEMSDNAHFNRTN